MNSEGAVSFTHFWLVFKVDGHERHHGPFDTLEETIEHREDLRADGVLVTLGSEQAAREEKRP